VKHLLVIGVLLVTAGLLMAVFQSDNHAACTSTLGQAEQALSANFANQCSTDDNIYSGGISLVAIGAVGLLIALIVAVTRRSSDTAYRTTAPSGGPPAGWFPDPSANGSQRWWNGHEWGPRRPA
jgi:hypothetical protein